MKNEIKGCPQCIHFLNHEKCFTCENKSNFELNNPEIHVVKFFLRLIIALIICITLITALAYLTKPKDIQPCEETIKKDTTIIVTASVYHACKSQCNSEYWITAFNNKIDTIHPDKHRFIAISRDLEVYFSKGDTVVVSGTFIYDGLWIVGDRMNKRFINSIDFLIAKGQYEHKFKDAFIKKYVNN